MDDEIRVTVIATGFDSAPKPEPAHKAAPAQQPGLYTAAAEKAAQPQPQAAADPAAPKGDKDPFDDIFKIFNSK